MHRQNFNAIGFFVEHEDSLNMPMLLEIKSPKNECRRFFSTFANFEKNKNRQTFWTCISKTTHPKVSFGKIKWNLIFWLCPAILDPY